MATGRKKLTHLLPEAGHSRRYLQDWWPFRFLCPIKEPGIQTPGRWLFWDISLPSSQFAGSLNKVLFLASTLRLSLFTAPSCRELSELGLSHSSWSAYQRNDFSEPRFLNLLILRKEQNSLPWGIWFCPLLQSFYIIQLLLCFLGAVLSGWLEMLPPRLEVLKSSQQIKQVSTFRWHIFFLVNSINNVKCACPAMQQIHPREVGRQRFKQMCKHPHHSFD